MSKKRQNEVKHKSSNKREWHHKQISVDRLREHVNKNWFSMGVTPYGVNKRTCPQTQERP